MTKSRPLSYLLSLALVLGVIVAVPLPASAQDAPASADAIVVDTTEDPTSASCDSTTEQQPTCSLRAALAEVGDGGVVDVPAGRYVLEQGQLTIGTAVTVRGAFAPPGPEATTIDAAGQGRVISVTAQGVKIEGIVITGGDVSDKNKDNTGGGILIDAGKGKNATPGELTLQDSTVTGNAAVDGGGIENDGVLTVLASTIDNNTATGKGGGLRDNGTSTITNSTIVNNTAAQGGGISTPGSTTATHATIVRNVAGNSSTGGVDVNGGSISLSYSIIANNVRANNNEASDCSGTPSFSGVNLISVIAGCNPEGEVVPASDFVGPVDPDQGDIVIEGDAFVGALADNGGPTQTAALFDESPALDAVTASAETVDQRGVSRPGGDGFDLGAYERGELGAEFALSVDTSNYDPLPSGTVEVGAVSVPVDGILEEILAQDENEDPSTDPEAAALRSIALRSIALRSIELKDIALRSIDLEDTALRSIVVESTALRSIALRSIALRSIGESIGLESTALRSILLSDIPLLDGGWDAILAGTEFEGLPLQSLTLEDLYTSDPTLIDGLSLTDVSLESTALRSIALRSILLAGTALRSIPLEVTSAEGGTLTGETAWCALFDEICDVDDPAQVDALGDLDLLDAQLLGANVDDVPVFDIPLAGLDSLESTALRSIALRSIALRSIDIESSALRSIALRSIALRSIDVDYIGQLVDCTAVDCDDPSTTLGDAAAAGALTATGDIGTLIDALASISDACAVPESPAAQDIGAEACAFVNSLTFGDLLLAFVAPDDPAWESLDLGAALLQNIGNPLQPTFDYVADITITDGPATLAVNLTLPQGFAAARAAGESAEFDGEPVEPETGDLDNVQFVIPDVGSGTHQLRIPARAGIVTGPGTCEEGGTGFGCAVGMLDATRGEEGPGTLMDRVAVSVVEAAANEPQNISTDTVPTLQLDGQLELAHIASSDDVDLFGFTVPDGQAGAQARILLSNIPEGVDYDLAVYAERQPSLRDTPKQELGLLGDIEYDLAPVDDVYSTDTVEDIQLDVPADLLGLDTYAVRDTSTKRSNEDEEVGTGALRPGDYYVAVTSFNGDLSDEPYGLRLRLDDAPALPTCAAPRFTTAPSGDPLVENTVSDGVNTVYVTNTRWLEEQLAGQADGTTVAEIAAAIDETNGINGVVAGVLPLDGDAAVVDAYNEWNTGDNRCSPEARNEVVRQIGLVLDELPESVENLVIVGGDGVVPMAAVPDLTEYSNESTFAAEVAFNGLGNEITGALGEGYLLSDDPYATEAGISIQKGDHELYLPRLNVGRLVETGPEIVDQLQRFREFNGQLDPGTTPGAFTSAVTGYDFLQDGAEAIAGELGTAAEDQLLDGQDGLSSWTDEDYLNLIEQKQYNVLSPNAHYDYESLLPGAFDGTAFSNDDLVTSAEVEGRALPLGAIIFTMGCHAGLPIDDVQIGAPIADWAQTYAGASNSYAAHTTYGYGDTEIVAYSERLTQIFARNLYSLAQGLPNAPQSVGEALVDAKQEYLQTSAVLTPYDEKILQSMTYYGLPMYDLGFGEEVAAPPASLLASTDSAEEPSPVSFGEPEGADGPTPVSIDLAFPVTETGPTNLNRVDTDNGSYFEVGGDVIASQFRPVEPLVQAEVPGSGPDNRAGGFLITSLTSVELDVPEDFRPYYGQPVLDSSSNEGIVEPGDGSFPATLQRVAPGVGDKPDRLLVAAGQFQDAVDGAGEVQRLFTQIGGDLYPLNAPAGEIAQPPQLFLVDGRIDDQQPVVRFEITTEDTAQRVYVMYREIRGGGSPEWRGLDLFLTGTDSGRSTWLGAAPVNSTGSGDNGAIVEFFAQTVGSNGRVGISDNKVYNYLTTLPDETEDFDLDLTCVDCSETNGYYPGAVIAEPSGDGFEPNQKGYEFTVDNVTLRGDDGDPLLLPSVEVTGDGGHVVLAVDPDTGARAFAFFVIDATPPELASEVQNINDGDRIVGKRVVLTADDIGPSGAVSIRYSVDPAIPDGSLPAEQDCAVTVPGPNDGTASEVVCQESSTFVDVTSGGTTTVRAWATDLAGNETEQELTVEVVVDDTPPTLEATVSPAEPVSGWFTTPVTVTLTATDASDVSVTYSIDGGEPTLEYGEPFVVDQEGNTTVQAQAVDAFGNTTSLDPPLVIRIDRIDPSAAASVEPSSVGLGEEVNVTFGCTDEGSGVADSDCAVDVDGDPVEVSGTSGTVSVPSDTIGDRVVTVTATDRAGNTASASATYTVRYGVCLDYDPTQAKNIGSNYTIKLTLCDSDGTNLSNRKFVLTAVSIDGDLAPGPNDSGNANSEFEFRFRSDGYIYNLDTSGFEVDTLGPGEHYLEFEVFDPGTGVTTGGYRAPFTLS